MLRLPPISTRTDPLCPYTPLFRSLLHGHELLGRLSRKQHIVHHLLAGHAARLHRVGDLLFDERRPDIAGADAIGGHAEGRKLKRSEEHTSELQSLMRISYAVFCLNKKKKTHSIIAFNTPLNK